MTKQTNVRFDIVDTTRGAAIMLMIIFHFCFLLKELNVGVVDFYTNPFWRYFRTLIVVFFLLIVGISLKLSIINQIKKSAYFKRLAKIICYALVITLVTYLYQPDRVVIIGILHFIAIASVLGLLFIRLTWQNLLFAAAFISSGLFLSYPVFNAVELHWLGLMTYKPTTLDYVPIFPWFGVVVLGIYFGHLLAYSGNLKFLRCWTCTNKFTDTLALLGRYSLNIYMLHVPMLYVLIFAYSIILV